MGQLFIASLIFDGVAPTISIAFMSGTVALNSVEYVGRFVPSLSSALAFEPIAVCLLESDRGASL